MRPYAFPAIALLAALCAAAGYAFLFSQVSALSEEAHALSSDIAAHTSTHAAALAARDALAELAEDEAFVMSRFVSSADIVPFLERLEGRGAPLGSEVRVVSVSDTAAEGKVTVALSISGSFDAVVRTLGRIEHDAFAGASRNVALDASEGAWTAAVTLDVLTPKNP